MIHKVADLSNRARLHNGVNLAQLDPQELLRSPVVDLDPAVDNDESRATIAIELDSFHYGKRSWRQRQCQSRYIELPGFPFALAFFQPTSDILALE